MSDHLSETWFLTEGPKWAQWTSEQNDPRLAVIVRRHADIQADNQRVRDERDRRLQEMEQR